MLVLSEKEVRELIGIDELIEALARAHVAYSAGKAVMPVRLVVPLSQIRGRITSMPAYLDEEGALGIKVVTYFQENPRRGLPAILATIALYDTESGRLLALMDGTYITAIRTACASALATRALAKPEAKRLGILGAGVQARAHLRALARVRPLARACVYSPSGKSALELRRELEPELGIAVEVVAAPRAAVEGADIVVTATTSKEPVLEAEWLEPGAHINAVGSHRPDAREIDGPTLGRARLFVDSREAVMAECGDVLLAIQEGAITPAHIVGEIGELLAGRVAGRRSAVEITLYKSVGIAVQDVAAARLAYAKARERGLGTEVAI